MSIRATSGGVVGSLARHALLEATSGELRAVIVANGLDPATQTAVKPLDVFAVFASLRLVIIRELGLGLTVAVLIDTTIIRSVLLPATMRLLGEWNWYLPRWLRWLPRVTLEEEEPTPAASRAP